VLFLPKEVVYFSLTHVSAVGRDTDVDCAHVVVTVMSIRLTNKNCLKVDLFILKLDK
jgi:hypothetical protein